MNKKTLFKPIILIIALFIISISMVNIVSAEPADDDYVFVAKTGKVWHQYRDCGSIAGHDAWVITYEQAKKKSEINGECSDCLNGNNRNQTVTGKTYKYNGSFSTSEEVDWENIDNDSVSQNDNSSMITSEAPATATTSSKQAENSDSSSNSNTATYGSSNSSASQLSSGNATSGNASSGSSSSFSDLMTESQRRKAFSSKINPKRGTTPVTPVRPESAGYKYANFGTYNSYASDNKLGNTPIYLLGTIMSVNKVSQSNNQYKLAIMVNDCDGYQWYMRATCLKDNFNLLKSEINGKAAYIYGTYAGYSGVTNRPMMDVKNVFVVGGNAVSIALYQ